MSVAAQAKRKVQTDRQNETQGHNNTLVSGSPGTVLRGSKYGLDNNKKKENTESQYETKTNSLPRTRSPPLVPVPHTFPTLRASTPRCSMPRYSRPLLRSIVFPRGQL